MDYDEDKIRVVMLMVLGEECEMIIDALDYFGTRQGDEDAVHLAAHLRENYDDGFTE